MSAAWIRERLVGGPHSSRNPKPVKRFQVCYRRGGREAAIEYAGTFRTKRDAEARRALVVSWLANGLDPKRQLVLLVAPVRRERLADTIAAMARTRRDVGESAQERYRNASDKLGRLGLLGPDEVTVRDLQEWVADHEGRLAPKTIAAYMSVYRLALDHADIEPNPARSPKLRLPVDDREEVDPFSYDDWHRVLPALRGSFVLPFRLMEATALRPGEVTKLELGDVDFAESRLRISKARTKGRTAGQRWIAVPFALMDELAELWPLEDREREQRVFPFLKEWSLRTEMRRALRQVGAVHRHPHQLRHRRISLWFRHGIDEITVSRWGGHSKASISQDVYAHVLIDSRDDWREFWLDVYANQTRVRAQVREVPVWPEAGS